MKSALPLKIAALATAAISIITPIDPGHAQTLFDETEVPQQNFVTVASPFGETSQRYTLIVMEQIPGQRACWGEIGSQPTVIDPLWDTFDFTSICRRNRDTNGYSIRINGQDYGQDYLPTLVRRGNDVLLVGIPRVGVQGNEILIGRSQGLASGPLKIALEPGWRFTKRTYQGQVLGHIYFSQNDSTTPPPPPPPPPPSGFRDITNDIYRTQIEEAVKTGFIAGFAEDNTFRPLSPLTREQLVSMVFEALRRIPGVNLAAPTSVSTNPFPDVPASRWSAAKIQWARNNQIVEGYGDGTFKPTQNVTRAELIAVMKKAAQYGKTLRGLSPNLEAKQAPLNFSDTSGHWSENLLREMSAYCNVASPVNESGTRFTPNTSAQRNYAAAATLRMLNCVKSEQR
jgi:N-acetylmuramoyl-L-alanine amidase